MKAAVAGVGFIGVVHVETLQRLGIEVVGVCAQDVAGARASALGYRLPKIYRSYDELVEDNRVDVVHIATPNHVHYEQAKKALAAGKHVICEKPLAADAAQSAELVALADRAGVVHCTNFNIRFYPLVQEARQRSLAGELGDIWAAHGSYLQDWLLKPSDWNWRLEPDVGGPSRAVADIGSHWLDLTQFVSGRNVTAVMADLMTAIPERRKPKESVTTFTTSQGETEPVEIHTEDVAHVLLRYEGAARGAVVISQVSAGRRNSLAFQIDGSAGSVAWCSERNEQLLLGHRDRPNELLVRDPAIMSGPVRGHMPGGHTEGFRDGLKELYSAVYRAVASGEPGNDYPTFRDGHRANVLTEAVLRSHREQRWVDVQ